VTWDRLEEFAITLKPKEVGYIVLENGFFYEDGWWGVRSGKNFGHNPPGGGGEKTGVGETSNCDEM